MADLITTLTPAVTLAWEQVTAAFTAVTAQPLALLTVGVLIAGSGIGLMSRIIHR